MFKHVNVIMRISKYKKALTKFKSLGFEKVFSDNLADAIGVTSTQVRKDFSTFGISGNRRGGYNIDTLIETIDKLLNKNETQKIIVMGMGNLGTALTKYRKFEEENIEIIAGFDSDKQKIDKSSKIPILHIDEIEEFMKKNKEVKMCILSVPDNFAQEIFETLVESGIKAVLNFTRINLKTNGEVFVNNVDIIQEIDTLTYYVNKVFDEE